MGSIAFPYTKLSDKHGAKKPYIYGVLRRGGHATPPVNFLIDTGSDYCVFDIQLVLQLLDFDAASHGQPTDVQGLEGKQPAYVAPADLFIRDLRRSFEIQQALYTKLTGIAGVLGHSGFLDQLSIRFVQAKSFEIEIPDDQ